MASTSIHEHICSVLFCFVFWFELMVMAYEINARAAHFTLHFSPCYGFFSFYFFFFYYEEVVESRMI